MTSPDTSAAEVATILREQLSRAMNNPRNPTGQRAAEAIAIRALDLLDAANARADAQTERAEIAERYAVALIGEKRAAEGRLAKAVEGLTTIAEMPTREANAVKDNAADPLTGGLAIRIARTALAEISRDEVK